MSRFCSTNACHRPHHAKGLCKICYNRTNRNNPGFVTRLPVEMAPNNKEVKIRVPTHLHDFIVRQAADQRVSISLLINRALENWKAELGRDTHIGLLDAPLEKGSYYWDKANE